VISDNQLQVIQLPLNSSSKILNTIFSDWNVHNNDTAAYGIDATGLKRRDMWAEKLSTESNMNSSTYTTKFIIAQRYHGIYVWTKWKQQGLSCGSKMQFFITLARSITPIWMNLAKQFYLNLLHAISKLSGWPFQAYVYASKWLLQSCNVLINK
jgi:hypothetical protein